MNVSTSDKKVLSSIDYGKNGAVVIIDFLETSIIETAPFGTVFSKMILNFRKCRNAPFRSWYFTMVRDQTFRKKVSY